MSNKISNFATKQLFSSKLITSKAIINKKYDPLATLTSVKLRKLLQTRRQQINPAEQHQAALQLITKLRQIPKLRFAKNIAIYLPHQSEINISLLIPWLTKLGKNIYLPIMAPLHQRRLYFIHLTPEISLYQHRWQIHQPKLATQQLRQAAWTLDIIILPIVGFDETGNRLGMGKGYYDATLAFKHQRKLNKPYLIGVAYQCQQVQKIRTEPWDVPLDLVVTEQQLFAKTGKRSKNRIN